MDLTTLNILLRIPLCIIPLIRAVYIALRDPDKRASDWFARLLFATQTPRNYWKNDAAVALFFILTTLPNVVDFWVFLRHTPDWFPLVISAAYWLAIVGSAVYWITFNWRQSR